MTEVPRIAGRMVRELWFLLYALGVGSRTAPLGDNSDLVRELAARAASLYGAGRTQPRFSLSPALHK
jgi:hypothetical protein